MVDSLSMQMSRPRLAGDVLIVEDEPSFARVVVAPHFARWDVRFAYNVPDALDALDALDDLRLATIDLDLPGAGPYTPGFPGGAGFHVVERARRRFPQARLIVLTGHLLPRLVNTAQRLGAEYLVKGDCNQNLQQVAKSMRLAEETHLDDHVIRLVQGYADEKQLSPRQAEILAHAVGGATREEMMVTFEIAQTTLKSHIRALLTKAGAPRLEDVTRELLARSFRELRRLRSSLLEDDSTKSQPV